MYYIDVHHCLFVTINKYFSDRKYTHNYTMYHS